MLEYIKKFNQLPLEIKNKISNREITEKIEELEKKYDCNLAMLVMRVSIKDIAFDDLRNYLEKNFKLSSEQAAHLFDDLKNKIFNEVYSYLSGEPAEKEEIQALGQISNLEKPKTGSNFYFSPEDEEEIRIISKKIENYSGDQSEKVFDIKKLISEIIKELNIDFGSQELLGRFEQIVHIYIKGVRNKIDTRLSLKKSVIDGGLNFDDDTADKIFKLIDKNKSNLNKTQVKPPPPKIKLPEEQSETKKSIDFANLKKGIRDFDYDFSKLKEQDKKIVNNQKADFKHSLAPPPPVIIKKQIKNEKQPDVTPPKIEEKFESKNDLSPAETPASQTKITPTFQAANRSIPEYGKKRMQDIKIVPKTMSPIDELRYMDLVSFRRMGENSKIITEKIKQKISFLEEERYSRRIEGIKAWRISPVNRLYLKIGQESIGQNKPISVIIEERRAKGLDCLSQAEIEAVIDLNQSLRY